MPNPYEQMAGQDPRPIYEGDPDLLGSYRGNKMNPWLYMDPKVMEGVRQDLMDQGYAQNPGAMGPPIEIMGGSGQPMAERQYEDTLQRGNKWIGENVVNPMSEAGWPNAGAGLGAGMSVGMETFMPGPEGWGFGMAGGGKKIESLLDYMKPEAREAAEAAIKKQRADMLGEGAGDIGVLDPYAKTGPENPYADMAKYDELQNRTIDPDTGLPIERRAEDSPFRETQKVVPKHKSPDLDTFMESLQDDDNYGNSWWQDFHEGDDWQINDSWESEWHNDWNYSTEVPTRADAFDRQMDALYNYENDIVERMRDDIYERIDPENLPQRFRIKHANGNAEDAETLRRYEDGEYETGDEETIDEWMRDWADDEAGEAFDNHIDRLKKQHEDYLEKNPGDGDTEVDWPWIDDDESFDFSMADYGEEQIIGDRTRRRRYDQDPQIKGFQGTLKRKDGLSEKDAQDVTDSVYDMWDDTHNQKSSEWWQEYIGDHDDLGNGLLNDDELAQGVLNPKDIDLWDTEDVETAIEHYRVKSVNATDEEIRKEIGRRIGDDKAKKISKEVIDGIRENINERREEIFNKGKDYNLSDLDYFLEKLKKQQRRRK